MSNFSPQHALPLDTTGWLSRRVAVTGATGFLGYHLVRGLVRGGARVAALVRPTSQTVRLQAAGVSCHVASLTDAAEVATVCRGCEVLFHLAGAVDFEADWERFRLANVEATRGVLEGARRAGVRRVVHVSSIVAVGAAAEPRALDERARWTLGRLRVPYVTTKRQAEQIALDTSRPGFEVVVVNPACIIGPDDFTRSEFGTLCRRFWLGRAPVYFGGGNNFVDVRDVAVGMMAAAERGRPGERYILGGYNRSYTDFFTDLARTSGRTVPRFRLPTALAACVAWVNQRRQWRSGSRSYLTPGQARMLALYFYFDCTKARRELGYMPRPWRQTLTDTYAFWMPQRSA